jgi:hypothetical protein
VDRQGKVGVSERKIEIALRCHIAVYDITGQRIEISCGNWQFGPVLAISASRLESMQLPPGSRLRHRRHRPERKGRPLDGNDGWARRSVNFRADCGTVT